MGTSMSGGQLEVIAGCMYSGKSEELIRRLRRAKIAKLNVFVVKPEIDIRSKNCVASHAKNEFPAVEVHKAIDILTVLPKGVDVLGIDEAQFLGDELVNVCRHLISRNIRVIVAGLDLDYRARPFGPMPHLLALADKVDKLTAICTVCGGTATRSHRIKGGTDLVQIGASGSYDARCHVHFLAPTDED